jgi:hypothetical protein
MSKLVVTLLVCVLMVGAAVYVVGKKVAPASVTKSNNLNTTISGSTVSSTDGSITVTAP